MALSQYAQETLLTTAFVVGATGYTGREVVRVLAERGMVVVAHVRPDSSRAAEWRERFSRLPAAVDQTGWDEPSMAGTLARLRPAVVFALLGTTRQRGQRARRETGAVETYETIDYGLTALLLRATIASSPKSGFVYLSAVGVGPDTRNPYLQARWKLETELRSSGVPYTIARPSFITDRIRMKPDSANGWRPVSQMRWLASLVWWG